VAAPVGDGDGDEHETIVTAKNNETKPATLRFINSPFSLYLKFCRRLATGASSDIASPF
jgi:hypothetical protein